MNWKNVYYLMQIERKSSRLLTGIKTVKYKENKFLANWLYWLAIIIGVVVGVFAWAIVNALPDVMTIVDIHSAASGFFATLPTYVLVLGFVFTLFSQIRRSGVKMQAESPYWLPITWQEHTLASILASLLGMPLSLVLAISSAILVFSVFNGLIVLALATSVAVFAAALLSSILTEVLRVLQVRFIGAVYKSSGRGAIWVRFLGSLIFFLIFYILYLTVILGNMEILFSLSTLQESLFFIPFIWMGLSLSNFFMADGSALLGVLYLLLSLAFIGGMFGLAVLLNTRFGLYEPPAIRVQKSGAYTPKTGVLGKLGFSTNEAALIHKDFKAFTRRRELMTIFITPVAFVMVPLMQTFSSTGTALPTELSLFYVGMMYLVPSSFMAMLIGTLIIGEEGQAVWRIYASPFNAKNLVKSKYFLTTLFGFIILIATGLLGTFIFKPSPTMVSVAFLEAFFMLIALGTISVYMGFRGADFAEIPRPRMIRQIWMFIAMFVCLLAGLAILAPFIPTALSSILGSIGIINFPSLNPFIAVAISGIIAAVITGFFYKLTLDNAKEFLQKAEV